MMLKRLVALAESTLKVLDMNFENDKRVDLESALLSVDMSIYDAVIEVYPKMVVRKESLWEQPQNVKALPVVNFDPIDELVHELNEHFQHVALFFWNRYGGDRIGLKWKPHELEVPAKVKKAALFVLGEHPRFSKFKNAGRAAEQQARRREDAIERQRNSRFDHFNHTRKLAENVSDDEDEIVEQLKTDGEEVPQDLRKKHYKSRYADELMLSEWLVDIPEQLSSEWMMVPSPVGKRVLVVAAKGATTAYNKAGKTITQFRSRLPGGSGKSSAYTILDCIMDAKKTFYCLDVLAWNGMDMSANPFDFRQFMLSSKLKETTEVSVSSRQYPYRFLPLPCCKCERALMEEMMRNGFDFELDGLLYYHSGVVYEAGQSPLVGWLKPWMLPEILNVPVPEKFLNENQLQQSSQQFIDAFNIEHRHTSKINKGMEVE
ncbi:DNA repair protein REV1like [Bombus terrestris] [Trichostrongylus colubriformis]|uniref:Snurportin-1 n=1 Tax=Trichostrongylus colubriformis TaxID=6319 RepID=A0AAN8J335_TRICO